MANRYVDPAIGNDTTGDGSSGNPYLTIQKAVNVSSGGDSIYIANTAEAILSAPIDFASGWGGGTSNDAPLMFTGWNNNGNIFITRGSTNIPAGLVNGSGVAYFLNVSNQPTYVIFKELLFYNFNGGGSPLIRSASPFWIFTCEIYNSTGTSSAFGTNQDSAYVFDSVVRNCRARYGVQVGRFGKVRNCIVKNSTIGNGGQGYSISAAQASDVQNNIIYDNYYLTNSHGIHVNGDWLEVSNNTIIGSGINSGIAFANNTIECVKIFNNIMQSWTSGINYNGGNAFLVGNNVYYNCGINESSDKIVFGLDLTNNDQTINPQFVDSSNSNYSINNNSIITSWPSGLISTYTPYYRHIGAAQNASSSLRERITIF